jgi:phosphopantetheinyl transferase (holo-ACP synthase)
MAAEVELTLSDEYPLAQAVVVISAVPVPGDRR